MQEKRLPYGAQQRFSVFEDTMVEMTWQRVQAAADSGAIALLPIGIVEGHGPHLDLSADFYLSTLSCRFLRQELRELGVEAVIAPPFYWGISQDVSRYAGTFSLRPETMKSLLDDIFASLKSWGFRRVFVQNAHGDPLHIQMIQSAIAQANEAPDFRVYFMWELDVEVVQDFPFPPMRENRFQPDYHAGAIETAQMATFFPEKIRGDVARTLPPSDSFHPLAYCGDPASYGEEVNIAEYTRVDMMMDARKVAATLQRDGK